MGHALNYTYCHKCVFPFTYMQVCQTMIEWNAFVNLRIMNQKSLIY